MMTMTKAAPAPAPAPALTFGDGPWWTIHSRERFKLTRTVYHSRPTQYSQYLGKVCWLPGFVPALLAAAAAAA